MIPDWTKASLIFGRQPLVTRISLVLMRKEGTFGWASTVVMLCSSQDMFICTACDNDKADSASNLLLGKGTSLLK